MTILLVALLLVVFLLAVGLLVVSVAGIWKMYAKAGKPGWGMFIPIYNTHLLIKIAGRPGWRTILAFLPVLNLIILILPFDIASRFGKGVGFGLLFPPFIFYPILGFGDAQYARESALPPVQPGPKGRLLPSYSMRLAFPPPLVGRPAGYAGTIRGSPNRQRPIRMVAYDVLQHLVQVADAKRPAHQPGVKLSAIWRPFSSPSR